MHSRLMSIEVLGNGPTSDQAISNAISSIKKTVFNELEELIVRIEPNEIEVVEAVITERKERFMFILFPRVKRVFSIKLRVEVELKLLNTSVIAWDKTK